MNEKSKRELSKIDWELIHKASSKILRELLKLQEKVFGRKMSWNDLPQCRENHENH